MSLINQALLFGLGFAAIPLVLHLLMKSKPKKVLFPALRLIQMRKKTSTRRLRLRHIWLLLLRTLLFALLVLAIARPSLPAAAYELNWTELGTLAGILAVAAAVYHWFKRKWQSQKLAAHDFRYRRTVLRGGTGVGIGLLTLLLVGLPYGKRISAEISGEVASDLSTNVPVAAVFLFDTSFSMDYRLENKTRLEQAREIAAAHLSSLPPGSRVCIADASINREMVFQGDLISAGARIDALKTDPNTTDLNARLNAAIQLQDEDRQRVQQELGTTGPDGDGFVREIYVFTDFARSAWRIGNSNLKSKLDLMPWVNNYFIDLSVEKPINCGVLDVSLSQQSATRGSTVNLNATLASIGVKGLRKAEVYVNDKGGKPVLKGQRTTNLQDGVGGQLSFPLVAPDRPFIQGEIRLVSSDPFVNDDVRHFTLGLNDAPRVLLIGEFPLDDGLIPDEAFYLQSALAPDERVRQKHAVPSVTYRAASDVRAAELSRFDIVYMINVRSPQERLWTSLGKFVARGGGLGVFLGNKSIEATSYNTEEAQAILPATLTAPITFFKGPFLIDVTDSQHPLFRRVVESNDFRAEFSSIDYRRGWSVEPVDSARVIAAYNDERSLPAWLERANGDGQVVMFTNGMDSIGDDGKTWSDLPNGWMFVEIAERLTYYLDQAADGTFNWISGQNPIVRFDRDKVQETYLLRKPSRQQLPGPIPQEQNFTVLSDANAVGHYRFSSGTGNDGFVSAFSVNSDDGESDFTQITESELTTLLGPDRFTRAKQIDELDRAVQNSRMGREVFPLLMILVVLFFLAEHFVANHFYNEGVSASADPNKRSQVAA
ncbi:MAG: BatA and WFA domain-containing protein [Planctomycetaceae bacterium]